jgi:hypothetical protein
MENAVYTWVMTKPPVGSDYLDFPPPDPVDQNRWFSEVRS